MPVGGITGTTFDGLILNGTVKAYDFTGGTKGVLLGQATSDSSKGLYSLALKVESRPVLLEVTGGYYIEEAGANTNIFLGTDHKLTALVNYATGSVLNTAITTYTHLAAGLAAYQIRQGAGVATAINDANLRVSNMAGINILTTTPKDITDIGNASATLTPELRYGFLAGAISMWTLNHTPVGAVVHTTPYTSIDFAQLMYEDISADGLLDGAGATTPLSFGTIPLNVDVYRLGIGVGIVQMAGNQNNKTGLTGAQVLSFAESYISNTDAVFNSVLPSSFAATAVTITTPIPNAWVARVANIEVNVQSPFGIKQVELLVDDVVLSTSTSPLAVQSFPVTTTDYSDGTHTISVRATDLSEAITVTSNTVSFDNTWPTATAALPYTYTNVPVRALKAFVCPTETGSGVLSVHNITVNTIGVLQPNGCWLVFMPSSDNSNYPPYWNHIQIKDQVGHCSTYTPTANGVYGGLWGLVSQTDC